MGMTGDAAGDVKPSQEKAPTGSLHYLTLAEFGYLGQVVLIAADLVLLIATAGVDYSGSIPSSVVETLLGLVISVAWFQVGRKVGNSWFLAAGISGAASIVLGLAISLMPSVNPSESYVIVAEIEGVVSLAYFVLGVGAFFSAARVFKVRLFRYAGYLLVVGFLVTFLAGMPNAIMTATQAPCVPSSSGQSCIVQGGAGLATYGLGFLVAATTSLVAGMGFHRARETVGSSDHSGEVLTSSADATKNVGRI